VRAVPRTFAGQPCLQPTADTYANLVPEASARARDALDGAFAKASAKAKAQAKAAAEDAPGLMCPESAPKAA
jgi:hypothetical protein